MPDPMQPVADACSDHDLHRVPGAVLAAMRASPGRYVTMQTLRDAIEAVTGGRSTEDGVRRAIVRIRARLSRAPAHPLDGLEPVQIAARLIDTGYSPHTAADAAEITYSVMATLRTGRPVPPRWGWGMDDGPTS